MERDKDGYILSTGRRFYANRGIVGMSTDFTDEADADYCGRIFAEGYDGEQYVANQDVTEGTWTDAEKAELANAMINMWQDWLQKATAK